MTDEPRYHLEDMEIAYEDGAEDLATKVVELIRQSDYEITQEEIVAFCEAEIGYQPEVNEDALEAA